MNTHFPHTGANGYTPNGPTPPGAGAPPSSSYGASQYAHNGTQGAHHAGPQPQPTPQQPSNRPPGFFNALRYSGWYRAERRTIGGVCAGVSARTGWDLTLVRGLTVIMILLSPALMALYGLAWAFLPEQRDGRIHTEQLVRGYFDAAQVGAGVLILMGVTSYFPLLTLFGDSGLGGLSTIAFLVAVVVIIVALVSSQNQHAAPPAYPAAGASFTPPAAPRAQGGAPAPQPMRAQPGSLPHYGAPMNAPMPPHYTAPSPAGDWRAMGGPTQAAPHSQPPQSLPTMQYPPTAPTWAPPMPAPIKTVSRRVNLVVTGLVLLTMAVTFFLMHRVMSQSENVYVGDSNAIVIGLVGGGICLLIVGIALAIASLRNRNSSWLVVFSVIGFFLAFPTMFVGSIRSEIGAGAEWISSPVIEYDWTTTAVSGSASTSRATLDLTDAPSTTVKTIDVNPSVLDLSIIARQDQPIRIVCVSGIDNVDAGYWEGGDIESRDWVSALEACDEPALDDDSTPAVRSATSDSWSDKGGITIRISDWLMTLSFIETAPLDAQSTPQSSSQSSQSGAPTGESPQSGTPQSGGVPEAASGSASSATVADEFSTDVFRHVRSA